MGDCLVRLIHEECDFQDVVPLLHANPSENADRTLTKDEALEVVNVARDTGYDFWIATLDSIPVGYARGTVLGDQYCSESIFVMPKHRNNGIGLALKLAVLEVAKLRYCDAIYTYVDIENDSSIRLQENAGFRPVGSVMNGKFWKDL